MDSEFKFHTEERLGGYVVGQPDPACHFPHMWSFLIELLDLQSVFDLGCGEGHALKFFADKGLTTFGIDGCERAIKESVAPEVAKHDLYDGQYVPWRAFDLAWCCEFVEHIEEKHMWRIFSQLDEACPSWVAITHALPGQGGHHHVNCRSSDYWIGAFATHEYYLNEDLTEKCRTLASLESPNNHFTKSGLIFDNCKT
jgi:SAM-dependent methyltransferase